MKTPRSHKRTALDPLLDAFLADLRRRRGSPQTVAAYREAMRRFLRFMGENGVERLQDVTPDDLAAYRCNIADRLPSPASRYQYLRLIRRFFGWLESRQHILISPAAALRLPKPGKKLGFVPSEEEMRRLLEQPDLSTPEGVRDRAFLEAAYSTGCRRSEMAAMDAPDLDLEEGTVLVRGKGGKERVVPLGRVAIQWLGRYLDDARPQLIHGGGRHRRKPVRDNEHVTALWIGTKGRRINPQIPPRFIGEYGRLSGIAAPVTPYALRRACATHMLRRGAHPVQIQMLLGHSSLRSLSQYLKTSITDLKRAHERARPGQ